MKCLRLFLDEKPHDNTSLTKRFFIIFFNYAKKNRNFYFHWKFNLFSNLFDFILYYFFQFVFSLVSSYDSPGNKVTLKMRHWTKKMIMKFPRHIFTISLISQLQFHVLLILRYFPNQLFVSSFRFFKYFDKSTVCSGRQK